MSLCYFFSEGYGDHRDLHVLPHSFPTRRSSDLQIEPRVLAAISRDPGLMEVAGRETDLYQSVSDRAFSGDRDQAKIAVLGAVYGQTSGDRKSTRLNSSH